MNDQGAGVQRDQRLAIEKIQRLNLVLRAIRDVNQLIVTEKDPARLIERACDLLVETRGYTSVVIVRTDDAQRPRIVAHRAIGAANTPAAEEAIRRQGLTEHMKRALRSTAPVVTESGSVARDLMHAGRSLGVIVIALPAEVSLDAEELDFIEEVAGDIAFALHGIELDEKRRSTEHNRQLANRILQYLNQSAEEDDSIRQILDMIQEHGDFEAVGIRLKEGEDFPYYEVRGGSADFVRAERHLCVRDSRGGIVRDAGGKAALEGMCGNVLCGRTDPKQPFFTQGGSFWTNSTTDLLATTTEVERQSRTRNRCNTEGYESVALIPLRSGDKTIGLLQLNDHRRDRFTPESIGFFEGLGASIGIALARQTAQAELRFRNLILQNQQDAAIDGILVVDVDGQIISSNRRFAEMWGISRDIIESKSDERALQAVSAKLVKPQEFIEKVIHLYASPEEKSQDEILLKDGRAFDRHSAPMIGADGKYFGRVWYFRDISEHRLLQAQIVQSDRLASMGMLAAGVAHEINNPLSYVLYNLESLAEDLPRLASALKKCLAVMAERLGEAERAAALGPELELLRPALLEDILVRLKEALGGTVRIKDVVRGLGTFSRVEQTRLAPVNLMQVIEDASNIALNEIKYRARLVKEYGETSPIMASDGRLSQVFLNLLLNAAHAIREGDVEHNEIRVRTWQAGEQVFAEVRDTGQGISEEHLPHIFAPFFTTKAVGVGTGLGLSISKNIIEGYGGRLEVSSQLGQGTSFVVRLPRNKVAEADQATPADPDPARPEARGRILVIDDEPGIRAAMVRMLKGHEVVEAASGDAARTILESDQSFDLILCDVMMSAMSGEELHRWLSAAHPELAGRVVFVTGGAFTPGAREYLARIDNLRLEKPIDATSLRRLVGELVFAARNQVAGKAP